MTDPHDVELIVNQIRPILAGKPPELQGAVLADLLAMFLAGHQGDDADALREEILKLHIDTVRSLIEQNDALMLDLRKAE